MSDRYNPDTATLASDDELLDALGRGQRPAYDDPLVTALAMWRAEIAAPSAVAVADPIRHVRHKIRWGVISAAVAAIIGGGVTVAVAADARPGSPLWPITERVWVDHAAAVSTEVARVRIDDARAAVTGQRPEDARRLIDEAERLIRRVRSSVDRARLTVELQQVRTLLDGTLGKVVPTPAPGGQPVPTAGPAAATPSAVPSPSPSGGRLPGPLPSLLPTLLPLPSLPLLG